MSERLQFSGDNNHYRTPEDERRDARRFLIRFYAAALLLSILAGVVIAIITRSPLSGLIPTSLLLAMRPMIRWAFSRSRNVK